MLRDVRGAISGLRRTPLFTTAVVLALGVGIGANATIFGLLDGLFLRPPGIRRPAELVRVFATTRTSTRAPWSYPEYLTIRDRAAAFDGVVAVGRRGAVVQQDDGSSELVLVNVTSLNFFTTLGVRALHGKLFAPEDEATLRAEPGVVLSNAYWRRAFNSDPAVIGRLIRLDRGHLPLQVRVLAVLPPTFRDLDAASDRDLWMPPATWMALTSSAQFERPDDRWFDLLARRRAAVPVERATADVAAIAAAMATEAPATNADRGGRVQSDISYRLERAGPMAIAVFTLVAIVVLITCVNVTNLLLARALVRTRERAVRVALGASRRRLVGELAIEVGALGTLGAAAGLLIAAGLIRLLPAIIIAPPGFSSFAIFALDARVFGFTLLVTLVSTLLFGVIPSWAGSRADVVALIKAESGAAARTRGLFKHALLVGQIAVSVVLVYSAAMLVRSFDQTRRADLGFTRDPLLAVWVPFGDAPRATLAEAQRQIEALPGVSQAAIAIRAPLSLSGGGLAQPVVIPDAGPAPIVPPSVKYTAVSSNYFDAMATPLVRGRVFSAGDEQPGEAVVVVNEQFAQTFFRGDAVGRVVRLGGAGGVDHRVVGVVANAIINRLGEPPEPYFYLPFARARTGEATIVIGARPDPAALTAPVKSLLIRLDPRLSPRRFTMLSDLIDYSSSDYRATAALGAMLAAIGLLLTTVGVYGVIASHTARRTKEVGIRVALGATRGQVMGLVYREGALVAAAGLVIGIPLALSAASQMASMLFGLPPRHLGTLAVTTAVLIGAVSAATLIPAWRAARIQPTTALREV
jgi:predicted permease